MAAHPCPRRAPSPHALPPAQLTAAYPELNVTSIAWEDVEAGAVDLARELMRAHVSVSADGVQAHSLWLLPRGAVHSGCPGDGGWRCVAGLTLPLLLLQSP